MIVVLPYQVDTLFQRTPWANVGLIALNVLCFALMFFGAMPLPVVLSWILQRWDLSELITYQFLHAGILHLVFNMLYLWVFGNAVCAVVNVWVYPGLYLVLGMLAGAVHLVASGSPVVGASGAISGIMGVYLAIYPTNKISCFYLFFIRTGTFDIGGYILILIWFAMDLFHAFGNAGHIAYWAHIGGMVCGFVAGIILLKLGLVDRTEVDFPSVLELVNKE